MENKYPVIKRIKARLKDNDKITMNQYYDYERRLIRSPILMTHLELLQKSENRRIRAQKQYKDCKEEHKQNEESLKMWKNKYDYAQKKIKEHCGEKSHEYQSAFVGSAFARPKNKFTTQ